MQSAANYQPDNHCTARTPAKSSHLTPTPFPPIQPQCQLEIAVSQHFYNKENRAPVSQKTGNNLSAFRHFDNEKCSPNQLATHILSGKAFAGGVFQGGVRKTCNFRLAWVICLDHDKNMSVERLANDTFIKQYAMLIYATPSSTPQNPRARVVFILDAPIEDAAFYTRLVKRLHLRFAEYEPDQQCCDPTRFFYGSDTQDYMYYPNNRLPLAVLERLPDAEQPKPGKKVTPSNAIAPENPPKPSDHQREVHRLPTHELPRHNLSGLGGNAIFGMYIDDVKQRLDPTAVAGQKVRCPNPDHIDYHPSFRISYDGSPDGWPVCTCKIQSQSEPWKRVGDWVGLNYERWLAVQHAYSGLRETNGLLDNRFREYLLNQKQVSVLRVLECLLLMGWQAGRVFTPLDAVRACKVCHLSEATVRKALNAMIPLPSAAASQPCLAAERPAQKRDTEPCENSFAVFHPSTPPEKKDTAPHCLGANCEKKSRGRQAQRYSMPDVEALYQRLGVTPQISDPITFEALSSAKQYRMTLNQFLIKRRPGQHPKKGLARRLGVSPRTVSTYVREDEHIEVEARFTRLFITQANVKVIMEAAEQKADRVWLEVTQASGDVQRYRATLWRARQQLREGHQVELVEQEANFYRYVIAPYPPLACPECGQILSKPIPSNGRCADCSTCDGLPAIGASVKNITERSLTPIPSIGEGIRYDDIPCDNDGYEPSFTVRGADLKDADERNALLRD